MKKGFKKHEKSAASKYTSFCGIFRKKKRKSIQKTKTYTRTYMTVNKKVQYRKIYCRKQNQN